MVTIGLVTIIGVLLLAAAVIERRRRQAVRTLEAVRGERDRLRLRLTSAKARLGEVDGVTPLRRSAAL